MSELTHIPCPLCYGRSYSEIKRFEDGVVVGECDTCGMSYTPVAHREPESLFFDNEITDVEAAYGPILRKEVKHFRDEIFSKYTKRLLEYVPGPDHLDVGCAHGFFLNKSREAGFNVTGVEPSEAMVAFAREHLNLNVHHGTMASVDLGDARYDAISFTDSMEYIPDPRADLERLHEDHMNLGAVVFIKVPNGDYFKLRHLLAKVGLSMGAAGAYSPSLRVGHYNHRTLSQLVTSVGMELVEVGYFDPIDSPGWYKHTGKWIEFESPWWMDWRSKTVRKLLHGLGELQQFFTGRNHLSQSVYVIARKQW